LAPWIFLAITSPSVLAEPVICRIGTIWVAVSGATVSISTSD